MGRLKEDELERLRTKTVELLLELRRAYLAHGGNAITHWDRIQNVLLSACRRCESPDEVATSMCRSLQLPALGSSGSRALIDLGAAVRELGAARAWLDVCERETGLIMAMARLSAEERRDARAADAAMKEQANG